MMKMMTMRGSLPPARVLPITLDDPLASSCRPLRRPAEEHSSWPPNLLAGLLTFARPSIRFLQTLRRPLSRNCRRLGLRASRWIEPVAGGCGWGARMRLAPPDMLKPQGRQPANQPARPTPR